MHFCASEHGHVSVPTSEEWKVAEKLMDLLKPIEGITKDISHARASLSLIIPSVNVLAVFLQSQQVETPDIETVRTTMLSSLTSRFSDMISCKYAVVACVLDPRFKDRFLDSVSKCRSKQWLKEEIAECSVVSSPQSEISTPNEEVASESQQSSTFEKIFDTLLARADTNHSTETTEIEKYLCEPLIDRKDDSLKWWRMNHERFPNLALVSQRFFSVPPTTVPSERLFSTVGLIYEEHRSSLLGENAEKLCFLNYNLRLLDWKY